MTFDKTRHLMDRKSLVLVSKMRFQFRRTMPHLNFYSETSLLRLIRYQLHVNYFADILFENLFVNFNKFSDNMIYLSNFAYFFNFMTNAENKLVLL